MPIYEYVCQECGKRFDVLRNINQADQPIICIYCQSKKTRRALSKFFAHNKIGPISGTSSSCANCHQDSCSSCGL